MIDSWHPYTPAARRTLPVRIRDWVALETSMTARVGRVADTPIDVEVLRQAQAPLYPDETGLVAEGAAPATVREVCLSSKGQPLLVARTSLTSRKLQSHPTIVKLGNKALGSLLFAGPAPCPYSAREYTLLQAGDPRYALARSRHDGVAQGYWARRTLFWLFDEPLLVTEIFLPALIHNPRAAWA